MGSRSSGLNPLRLRLGAASEPEVPLADATFVDAAFFFAVFVVLSAAEVLTDATVPAWSGGASADLASGQHRYGLGNGEGLLIDCSTGDHALERAAL